MGFVPSLWIGHQNKQRLKTVFPDVELYDYEAWWIQGWRVLGSEEQLQLPFEITDSIHRHWDTLMSLMVRSAWRQLPYYQSRHRIYGLYTFFVWYLQHHDVCGLLMSESPHQIPSYLLYTAARELGIPTPMFCQTSFPGYIYLTDEIGGPVRDLSASDGLRADGDQTGLEQFPDAAAKVHALRTLDPEETVPDYMRQQKVRESSWLNRFRHPNRPGSRNAKPTLYGHARRIVKGLIYPWSEKARTLNQGRQFYSQIADENIKTPYVFVALHYQPERTTNPDGGIFDDQLLMIRYIASAVPNGWTVCVKEHPSQFYHFMGGHLARTSEFYESVRGLKNVQFLPVDILGPKLMANAEVVATITGTIGFEAAMRNIPVLAFGRPWYRDCPGVTCIETAGDVHSFFESLESRKGDSDRTTEASDRYLAQLLNRCQRAYVHEVYREASGITDAEWIETISGAFAQYMSRRLTNQHSDDHATQHVACSANSVTASAQDHQK
jgi:hypothetical protein